MVEQDIQILIVRRIYFGDELNALVGVIAGECLKLSVAHGVRPCAEPKIIGYLLKDAFPNMYSTRAEGVADIAVQKLVRLVQHPSADIGNVEKYKCENENDKYCDRNDLSRFCRYGQDNRQ